MRKGEKGRPRAAPLSGRPPQGADEGIGAGGEAGTASSVPAGHDDLAPARTDSTDPPVAAGNGAADASPPPPPAADATVVEVVPEPQVLPTTAPEPEFPPPRPPTEGSFVPYVIGDAGKASKVVPVLDDDRHRVHDTIVDGVSIKDAQGTVRLVARGASVRGLAHRHKAVVRQDDFAMSVTPDRRYFVAAVADGVSNSPRSHRAARVATHHGVDELRRRLREAPVEELDWGGLLRRLAELVRHDLASAGAPGIDLTTDMGSVAQQSAATVVFAVVEVEPDEFGGHAATVVRIGDTSGWVLRGEGRWEALGDVKNAGVAIAESAVAALPLVPDAPPSVDRVIVQSGSALVLMSDGIGDPLGNGASEVGSALAHLWHRPPAPLAFAAQVDFARRTFDDDRTAVAIWAEVG